MSLILPILLPDEERNLLMHFADEKHDQWTGSHDLRTQLRRLRFVGLIKMRFIGKDRRFVSEMKDGLKVDLSDYVELTDLGKHWVEMIKEADRAGKPEEP